MAKPRRSLFWLTREEVAGWLFLSPSIIAFVIFTAIPAIATLVLTFYRWDFATPPVFVGLHNWINLFSGGAAARSILTTIIFGVITVPTSMGLGLALALALDRMPFGKLVFRSIFFMPVVTSMISISFVWQNMYATDSGLLNYLLSAVGLGPVPWLSYGTMAVFSVSIMMIWSMTGFAMLVYLAGLQQVDESLREAALLDGAGPWNSFFHIVRPLLGRSTFFLLVTSTIGVLQTFEAVYVLTSGGPGDSTTTIELFILRSSFRYFDAGSSTTAAVALFVLMLLVTLFQMRRQRSFESA